MPIEFQHAKTAKEHRITSAQLPGWACSGPTDELAMYLCAGSLRSYLREHPDLDPKTRQELRAMMGIRDGRRG